MIARVNLAALLKEVKEKSRMKSQKKRSGYRQEYYLKNRERIARAKHEYYIRNKEKIAEKRRKKRRRT